MTDGEIRSDFLSLAQAMTTQDQALANQSQDMTAQANRVVGSPVQQNASTMASRVRDSTNMNPSMFFGSKVNEYP